VQHLLCTTHVLMCYAFVLSVGCLINLHVRLQRRRLHACVLRLDGRRSEKKEKKRKEKNGHGARPFRRAS
jgi:hypothetical protein